MASCAISSNENRHIVTCDIPGAFLQLDWPADKPTYLRFDGIMVDMLCKIDSSLKNKIIHERNGQKFKPEIFKKPEKLTRAALGESEARDGAKGVPDNFQDGPEGCKET